MLNIRTIIQIGFSIVLSETNITEFISNVSRVCIGSL